ncbi:MAG: nucleoside deaminase [Anaerolineales bacterium]|nr:nucleoside deaminase [Anaerolineales bacterium]
MQEDDQRFIRATIEIARNARERGNHPFGALLVDEDGQILIEAENTVVLDRDPTGHAEINLIRRAASRYDSKSLTKCTIYASTEPCPMCAGALFWANAKRVVFGLSQEGLYKMIGWDTEDVLYLPCREIFGRGQRSIEVVGPILEDEALEVHKGFWN